MNKIKNKRKSYPYWIMIVFFTIYTILLTVMSLPIFLYYHEKNNNDNIDGMIYKMDGNQKDYNQLPIIDILEEQPKIYDDTNKYIDNGEIYGSSDDNAINELKEMVANDLKELEKRFKL